MTQDEMVCCVYVLISLKDNKRYIGSTVNLSRRIVEHSNGLVKSTKYRRPLQLFAFQRFDNIVKARIAESNYKKSRGAFDRAINKGLFELVS